MQKLLEFFKNYHSFSMTTKWLHDNGLDEDYEQIVAKTSFLYENTKIQERVFCIVKNINEQLKCVCGKNLKFEKFSKGYLQTCGEKQCLSNYFKEVQENGLTRNENRCQKKLENQRKDVDKNGLNGLQRIARKAVQTKKNTIINGLNKFEIASIKRIKNSLSNDTDFFHKNALKSAKTMNEIKIDKKSIYELSRLKTYEKRLKIQENGLNSFQNSALKTAITRKSNVNEKGENSFELGSKKAFKTMRSIVDSNGIDLWQKAKEKSMNSHLQNIDENGFNSYQRCFKILNENKKIKGEDGLTGYQRESIKGRNTKLNKIDEDGLNVFQRAFKNGAGKNSKLVYYKNVDNTKLYYQGEFEKKFLDFCSKISLIELVKNPSRFVYFYKSEHYYFADYTILGIIFEIKSNWTYDNNGKDIELRKINNLKWKSVLEQNLEFFVVWNNKFIMKLELNDFLIRNIEDSLFIKENFKEFNEENFLKIINNNNHIYSHQA